jgi:hypothetical protein
MPDKTLPCPKATLDLLTILGYMNEGKTSLAVREGGRLLEEVLKEIYRTLFFSMPPQQQKATIVTENLIGKGHKSAANFTLGEIVGLYTEARLQKKWITLKKRDPRLFAGVDLATLVTNRNYCVHLADTADNPGISWCQAELSISMLKTFLIATGYTDDFASKELFTPQVDLQSLWQICKPQELVIITANSAKTPTGEYMRPATGIGQVKALALVVNALSKAYSDINFKNIHLSTDQIYDRLENDLIILGGPKNNQIALEFLEILKDLQPGRQEGSVILWADSPLGAPAVDGTVEEFCGEVGNETVRSDYALLVRADNVFNNDGNSAFLFSGSHTYGTMAAAKYFVEKYAVDFPQEAAAGLNFSIVIKCTIRNEYPLNISVVKTFFWARGEQ